MSESERLKQYYSALSDDALIAAHREGMESYRPDVWRILTNELAGRALPDALPDADATADRPDILTRSAPGLAELIPVARRFRIALLYAIFAIPAILLAAGFSALAVTVADLLRFSLDRVPGLGLLFSLTPALAGGFVTYSLVARHALRPASAEIPSHLWRTWPLYAGVACFGTVFILGFRSPGFGMVAPVFLWPALALTGGIVADIFTATSPARRGVVV